MQRQDIDPRGPGAAPPRQAGHTPTSGLQRLGIAVLILAAYLATAGLRPLAMPDEGRYVGIAWEMMRSGDWLTPTLDGLPYFHKPPLFYWLTAAAMSAFGPSALAARAAPVLGAWIATFGLYLFCRRWCGERLARLAAVALASMPLAFLGGQYANMDMLVAGLISAAVLWLADAALRLEAGLPHRRPLVAGYAAAGFGVLAKGLIGAALPLFVIVAWLVVTGRARRILPLISASGLVVFSTITLPWFIALQLRFAGFLDYFFIVQQVKRFAETGFNNARPFWFYPVLLAVASLPWLPWLPPLLRRRPPGGPAAADSAASATAGAATGRAASSATSSAAAFGPVPALMGVWMAVVTLFFSIPQSKLPGYILPAVPPLACLIADACCRLLAERPAGSVARGRLQRWWLASAGVSLALGLAVVVYISLRPIESTRDLARALARDRATGEPVYMLGNYYFDIPFYARLEAPVVVVDVWDTPEVRSRDNWRKEMADAGDFAPALADRLLVTPARLPARVCASPVSWFVGANDAPARHPFLAAAAVVETGRKATLWRLDRQAAAAGIALGCAADPAGVPITPVGRPAPN